MVKKSKKKAVKSVRRIIIKKSKKPAKKAAKSVKKVQKAVKKIVKKAVKRPAAPKATAQAAEQLQEKEIGVVTHYFTNISVAVIKLSDTLRVGDEIHIKGATSDFKQKVESMQVEHDQIQEAKAGQSIGLKVVDHARENDAVYKA